MPRMLTVVLLSAVASCVVIEFSIELLDAQLRKLNLASFII